MVTQRYQALVNGSCKCYITWKKGLCNRNYSKDIETRRFLCIIPVGPKYNHKYLMRGSQMVFWETQRRGGGNMAIEAEVVVMQT